MIPTFFFHPCHRLFFKALIVFSTFLLLAGNGANSRAGQPDARHEARYNVLSLDLSRPPTEDALRAAGQLGGRLHPTGVMTNDHRAEAINWDFGRAIEAWNRHEWQQASAMFRQHLNTYPDSPWAAEAALHIGCDATYHERYSEAEQYFQEIIQTQKDNPDPGGQMLLNKARQRLGIVRLGQNDPDAAVDLFRQLKAESPDWRQRTYAAHWIQRIARLTSSNRAAMMDCGKQAIAMTLESLGRTEAARSVRATPLASLRGQNLSELVNLAGQHDLLL